VTLYAIDGGEPARTGSVDVDIAVVDANDNRPEFEQSVYDVKVPENTAVGSVLVQVRAKDRDAGLNGRVRYKFSRHTAHEYATLFGIRPDNGKIFLHRRKPVVIVFVIICTFILYKYRISDSTNRQINRHAKYT